MKYFACKITKTFPNGGMFFVFICSIPLRKFSSLSWQAPKDCQKYLHSSPPIKKSTAFRVEKRYFTHRKAVLFSPKSGGYFLLKA